MGVGKGFSTSQTNEDEQRERAPNYYPRTSFDINDHSIGYWMDTNFDQSMTIAGTTYKDIDCTGIKYILDKNNISQEEVDYSKAVKNKTIKVLVDEYGSRYFIYHNVWWSKTLGLMRFRRNRDGVVFTRVF
jgi:hypothetical protein